MVGSLESKEERNGGRMEHVVDRRRDSGIKHFHEGPEGAGAVGWAPEELIEGRREITSEVLCGQRKRGAEGQSEVLSALWLNCFSQTVDVLTPGTC